MHRGGGRVESPGGVAPGDHRVGDAVQFRDEVGRRHHGIGAEHRLGRMRLVPVHRGEVGDDALVRVGDLEVGGLADDHRARARQVGAEARDGVGHPEAGGLLVVGQEDVDRALQVGGQEVRDRRERQGAEALHVDGAAPIGAPLRDPQGEGVGAPGLARHRDHVGMAGEHDAAVDPRADRGEQGGLVAGRVGHALERDAEARQVIGDPVDQREVRFRTLGVEGHEPRQQVEGGRAGAVAGHRLNGRCGGRGANPGRRRGSRPRSSRPHWWPWCSSRPSGRPAW